MSEKIVSEVRSLATFYHLNFLHQVADVIENLVLENERLKWKLAVLEKENKRLRRGSSSDRRQ
jgi:hypothetical protein